MMPAMRIASVVTPTNDHNLRLAHQIGVTDIVGRYPGPRLKDLLSLRDWIEKEEMRLSVIEGFIPHGQIVHGGPHRDQQIESFAQLIRNMGEAGVPICCYNFMPNDDWARTSTCTEERGGALVTSFDADQVKDVSTGESISAKELWENLEYFLRAVVPVAERAGVKLALHPDDPPLSSLGGQQRIMFDLAAFERLIELVPSEVNGVCFCQGCFAEMGEDIPAVIHRLGKHIHFAHFRDVQGCMPAFRETFHDNGQTDMAAAMRAYRDIGFEGPVRPDHVPTLVGESPSGGLEFTLPPADQITVDTFNGPDVPVPPGYTMLGRLFAVGYMRGLMDAVMSE